MRNFTCFLLLIFLIYTGCKKSTPPSPPPVITPSYVTFTILKGAHYASGYDYTHLEIITASHQHFKAIFDSSAIYSTVDSTDQEDVNKLFGFSDNQSSHHAFSARIGWAWGNNSLKLFGYTYNGSIRAIQQLAIVPIGQEIDCNIGIDTLHKLYLFTINGTTNSMPRTANTTSIIGYKLYPYFGGNEVAPHNVTIKVKELP